MTPRPLVLPPPGHAPAVAEVGMLAAVGVGVAQAGRAVAVWVPVDTDALVGDRIMKDVEGGGTKALMRLLAHIPSKQATMLVVRQPREKPRTLT